MAVGDIYLINVHYGVPSSGDGGRNIFFYQHVSGTFELEDLADTFRGTVILAQRALQSTDVNYQDITITNLFDPAEFYVETFANGELQGTINSVAGNPFDAVGFLLRRASRFTRNGAKRVGGIPDAVAERGVIVSTSYLTAMADYAEALAEPIEVGVGDGVLNPVIVKRIKTANPDYPASSSHPFIYSLPTDPGDAIVSGIAAVSFTEFVTTQNSRKS